MAKFEHERHGPGGGAVIVCEPGKVQSGASGEHMIPPDASIEEKVYKEVAKREARLTRLVKDQVVKGLVDEFSSGHRY